MSPSRDFEDLLAVQAFLYLEARLLDERRWEEWLELWADDARIRMPTRDTVPSDQDDCAAEGSLWWLDETVTMLRVRVAKLRTGKAWAEEPPSRTRRLITNVEVEAGQAPDELNVRSAFLIHRSRHSTNVELHVGGRTDVLRRVDNGFRIRERTVMINASVLDAPNLALFV